MPDATVETTQAYYNKSWKTCFQKNFAGSGQKSFGRAF